MSSSDLSLDTRDRSQRGLKRDRNSVREKVSTVGFAMEGFHVARNSDSVGKLRAALS